MAEIIYFVLLLIVVALIVVYEIYNSRTHIKCKPEQLREDATVISVKTKAVGLKRTAKFRTKVVFSDGFEYISHMTEREDKTFYYTVSFTPQMKEAIISLAKSAHLEELREYQRKMGIPVSKPVVEKTTVESADVSDGKKSSEDNTWICPACKKRNLLSSSKCWNCDTTKEG